MRIAFDVETNGLLRDLTTIHCVAAQDIDSGEQYFWSGNSIKEGLAFLLTADTLVGHNIIGYDYEAIRTIYPRWKYEGKTLDTLILSRLFFTDLLDRDFRSRPANMPGNLYGRHSLESYGYRLNEFKGSFHSTTDWKEWSEEMEMYCVQDVNVTVKLWNHFQKYLQAK